MEKFNGHKNIENYKKTESVNDQLFSDKPLNNFNERNCGNKANTLNLLKRCNLNIPQYYATDKEFFYKFLKMCGVYEEAQMVEVKSAFLKESFEFISNKIQNSAITKNIEDEIYELTKNLKFPVAVRSSSSAEDDKDVSCAGLFYTALNVERENLIQEIKNVICSLYSNKCLIALDKQIFHPDNYYMGVIIQEMIPAEWSGVAFSQDPVLEDNDTVVIEMVEGLGEKLVSGLTNSIHLSVEKDSKVSSDVKPNKYLIQELVDKVCKLEYDLGYPIDVEWAIYQNKLFILQCRPIVIKNKEILLDNYKFFNMADLSDNYDLLGSLKKRYTKWLKKDKFFNFCRESKIQTNEWNFLAFNKNKLKNINLEELLKNYKSPYIIYHLNDKYVGSCKTTMLYEIIDNYTQINENINYCIGIRESIPNVMSAISHVNANNEIQVEVVYGKMGVLNNGIVAPSLYMVDENNKINIISEKLQYEYIFSDEKFDTIKTNKMSRTVLEDNLIKDIAQKTRMFTKQFGTCSVEWWIWDKIAYAADMSILKKDIDTKAGRIISTGEAKGILRTFPKLNEEIMENMNMFSAVSVSNAEFDIEKVDTFSMLDKIVKGWKEKGDVILYSSLPYIYLTPFVKSIDGFVFENASSLCHLSLIIREAGIPAISLENMDISSNIGKEVILNAREGTVKVL